MKQLATRLIQGLATAVLLLATFSTLILGHGAAATTSTSTQTGSGSIGLEGKISAPAPTQAATISTPSNGASFTNLPITVAGLCPRGTLVKLFSNNVFIGSVACDSGSYSLSVDLFDGQNDLVARVYDALDQAGPDSNMASVTYNSGQFNGSGSQLTLTSVYASRGADPGAVLTWPIILSGGVGPYAISVDWGDNSPAELISEQYPGSFNMTHTYKTAGTYKVIVKVTDSKGNQAILPLSGVANGAVQSGTSSTSTNGKNGASNSPGIVRTQVLWWPAIAMIPLIAATFFIGSRHRLHVLRRQLEKQRGS